MSVYVDNARLGFLGMKMCHMVADSTQELLAMADRIGLKRGWIQKPGTPKEHFDICLSKRKLALAAGAISICSQDLARLIQNRRNPPIPNPK